MQYNLFMFDATHHSIKQNAIFTMFKLMYLIYLFSIATFLNKIVVFHFKYILFFFIRQCFFMLHTMNAY